MKNSEVAEVLNNIADLLELQAVQFKPRAYRKAARNIEEFPDEVESVFARGGKKGLMDIPGVGEGIADKVAEFLETGRLRYYEDLKRKFPAHISSLIEVPGIGPKKVKVLGSKLGIRSVEDLERAAKRHLISRIRGFGEKSEEDILKGIELVRDGKKRTLLGAAMRVALDIEKKLDSLEFVSKAVVAGSFRRRQETVGDLDVLVVSDEPRKVSSFFVSMPDVKRVLAKGETKSSVILDSGLQVDLRVVKEESFGAALQYFSGDIQHNVRLREIALKKGWKLNEYGLFDRNGGYICGRREEDVYRSLGMGYVEPELRCDKGEIEAALEGKLPKLVPYGSVKGDLHVHTSKSDGSASLQEMVSAAKQLGYEYIAITDHSVSERIARGLSEEEMDVWLGQIREFARKVRGIKVFAGSEVSIRPDGSLDYSDDLLKRMDIVVASIHSRFKSSREDMTKRILKALETGHVDILGHPTGRLIYRREPYDVDLPAVFRSAVKNNVFLEINSQIDRMDLKDVYVREANGFGAKFAVDTDAHSVAELRNVDIGVGVARRGWLGAKDIVNTRSLSELPKFFKRIQL